MSHIPNKKQEAAFNRAIKALENCKKLGLVIYAKQWDLTAYTKQANEYAEEKCPLHKLDYVENHGTIPYLSAHILADSGADDFACYVTEKDHKKYNPDDL